MNTTTKTLKFSLIIAVLFLSGVHSVHAKDVVLHFNQWFPKDHWSQTQGLYPWFEEIEKVTEGRVTVAISDQPLASPRKSYQAVVDGAVDIAWGPHGYKPDRFPLSKIVEQPFTSHDAGVSSAAYWEIWERFFQPSGMQSDVVTLGMHTSSGNNIHMRNRSVTNAHEMLYSRLGVHTKTIGHIMGDYGFGYVLSPITQLEEMLLSNEIQGTVISDDWSIGFNLSELLNTVTHVPGGVSSSSFYIVINKDKWAMISPKDQAAIQSISGKHISQKMGVLWHQENLKAQSILEAELGDRYATANPEFISDLEWIFNGELEQWIQQANKLGVNGQAAVELFSKLREDNSI